ncbi:MAG: hypothetical protein M1823_000617 [Watsoniomyces obsoletus]|nr:MAG: hypothetical protein M1823_000617 [Watsoniomyces obsoletus]
MAEPGNQKTLRFASPELLSPPDVPPPTLQATSQADTSGDQSDSERLDFSSANRHFSHAVALFHAYSWHESIALHHELIRRILSSSSSTPVAPPPLQSHLAGSAPAPQQEWINLLTSKLWFNIGVIRCHLGSYALAIDAFNRSLHFNSECVMGWFCLGIAFFETGEFRKALRRFRRCWGFFRIPSIEVEKRGGDIIEEARGKKDIQGRAGEEDQTSGPSKKKKTPQPKAKVKLSFEKDGLRYSLMRVDLEYNIRLCLLWKLHKQVNSERPSEDRELNRLPAGIIFEPLMENVVAVEEEAVEDEDEEEPRTMTRTWTIKTGQETSTGTWRIEMEQDTTSSQSRRYTIPRSTTDITTPFGTVLDSSGLPETITPVTRLPPWSSTSTSTLPEAGAGKEGKKKDKLPLLKGLHFPRRLFQRRGTFPQDTTTKVQDEVPSDFPAQSSGSGTSPSKPGSNKPSLMRGHGLVPVRMRYISPSPPSNIRQPVGLREQQRGPHIVEESSNIPPSGQATAETRRGIHPQEEGDDDREERQERRRVDSHTLIAPEATSMRIPVFKGKKSRLGQLFKPLPPLPETSIPERASYPSIAGSSSTSLSKWVSPPVDISGGGDSSLGASGLMYPPRRGQVPPPAVSGYTPFPVSRYPAIHPTSRHPYPTGYSHPGIPTASSAPLVTSLRRKRVSFPLLSASSTSTPRPVFQPLQSSAIHRHEDTQASTSEAVNEAINEAIYEYGYHDRVEDDNDDNDEEEEDELSALGLSLEDLEQELGLGSARGLPPTNTTTTNVRSTNEMFSPETYGYSISPAIRPPPPLRTNKTTTLIPRTTGGGGGHGGSGNITARLPYRFRSNTAPSTTPPARIDVEDDNFRLAVFSGDRPDISPIGNSERYQYQTHNDHGIFAEYQSRRPRRRGSLDDEIDDDHQDSPARVQYPAITISPEHLVSLKRRRDRDIVVSQLGGVGLSRTTSSFEEVDAEEVEAEEVEAEEADIEVEEEPEGHENQEEKEEEDPRNSYILARRASAFQRLGEPRADDSFEWPEREEMSRRIWGGGGGSDSQPNQDNSKSK